MVLMKYLTKRASPDAVLCAAAAAVALKSEPIIKYRLDFGSLPTGVTTVLTSPIINFIEMLVNTVAVPMLLWPNRITVSPLTDLERPTPGLATSRGMQGRWALQQANIDAQDQTIAYDA
jgi:hypothetical protein